MKTIFISIHTTRKLLDVTTLQTFTTDNFYNFLQSSKRYWYNIMKTIICPNVVPINTRCQLIVILWWPHYWLIAGKRLGIQCIVESNSVSFYFNSFRSISNERGKRTILSFEKYEIRKANPNKSRKVFFSYVETTLILHHCQKKVMCYITCLDKRSLSTTINHQ